jgi:hypothetical protein
MQLRVSQGAVDILVATHGGGDLLSLDILNRKLTLHAAAGPYQTASAA